MTRHVLRIEVRRGIAPLALAVFTVAGTALLFNETEHWAGRWAGLAGYVRVVLIILVPLALAVGAWQGGREHRRRIGELLASTPRPVWQQTLLRWGAAAAGGCGGTVVAWVVCAAFVARVATYSGGGWWWHVLVGLVALGAATAVGYGIGRVVPWMVSAPVVGLLGYVAIGILSYVEGEDGRGWLSPATTNVVEGAYLPASFHALQAVWFAAAGGTVLMLVGARRRWLALGPAAAAAAAGLVIAVGPGDGRWHEDPAALEPVCVDGTPDVCTTQETAFLLDDLAVLAGDVLGRLDGIDGVPGRVRATAYDQGWTPDEDVVAVSLRPYTSWRGTLSATGEYGASLVRDLIMNALPVTQGCQRDGGRDIEAIVSDVSQVAARWAGAGADAAGVYVDHEQGVRVYFSGGEVSGSAETAYAELASLPTADQRRWIERYAAAARGCEIGTLRMLRAELA